MTYHISRTLRMPFDAAIAAVTESLKTQGFGIMTEIDVQGALKSKIGVEFRPYRILGACNPKIAHEAILAEDKAGTMMPCNVVVQQRDDGTVEISAVDPVVSFQAVGNTALNDLLAQVRDKLKAAVDGVDG